jgi:hypothetical protein
MVPPPPSASNREVITLQLSGIDRQNLCGRVDHGEISVRADFGSEEKCDPGGPRRIGSR